MCSPSVVPKPVVPDDDDTVSKSNMLTLEEISEIFKKQIKKLEDSSSIEVNTFEITNKIHEKKTFFSCRKKFLRTLVKSFN